METEDLLFKLGEDVKRLRLLKLMTRQELADKAGVSINAMKNLELGGHASVETLIRVVSVLQKLDWLNALAPVVSINPLYMINGRPRRRGKKGYRRLCRPAWLTKSDLIEMKWARMMARERTRETGVVHVVDHIVPLLGDNVCGLDVPSNLQIITRTENSRKSNKFKP